MPLLRKIQTLSLFLLVGAWTSPTLAGTSSYQCMISEQLQLQDDGRLLRPSNAWLIGKRFSIDRATGRIVGPEGGFWSAADSKFTVLATGNDRNSFKVQIAWPAASNGMHLTVISVDEFVKSMPKPFLAISGSEASSGLCE